MASGSVSGGTSDCEGEEQEDPSSSPSTKKVEEENDELSAFRREWQKELEPTPAPLKEEPAKEEVKELMSDDERSKELFRRGVKLERAGKLYEAIQYYKRAMQIDPDVETKVYENAEQRPESPDEDSDEDDGEDGENANEQEYEDDVEGEELLARLQRTVFRKGMLCEPEVPTKGAHISWLPYEVVLVVLRWVVSAELDVASLESVARACRGLYVAAREPDLWRSICLRTWGEEDAADAAGASWRSAYLRRPRMRLNGCYISKTTYLRHGENSFQDQFYRPWYLIDYYRYLRFFPDGVVLSWTTPDEPAACVAQLKHRAVKPGLGVMLGQYRLIGDKVVIVIKKTPDKKVTLPTNTRFRNRRKEPEQEQIFHLELQLRTVRNRRNFQLQWLGYSVCTRRDQWTQFELTPGKFPPFAFSRVRNYTAESYAPLL